MQFRNSLNFLVIAAAVITAYTNAEKITNEMKINLFASVLNKQILLWGSGIDEIRVKAVNESETIKDELKNYERNLTTTLKNKFDSMSSKFGNEGTAENIESCQKKFKDELNSAFQMSTNCANEAAQKAANEIDEASKAFNEKAGLKYKEGQKIIYESESCMTDVACLQQKKKLMGELHKETDEESKTLLLNAKNVAEQQKTTMKTCEQTFWNKVLDTHKNKFLNECMEHS